MSFVPFAQSLLSSSTSVVPAFGHSNQVQLVGNSAGINSALLEKHARHSSGGEHQPQL
jgi:hypothetical protein